MEKYFNIRDKPREGELGGPPRLPNTIQFNEEDSCLIIIKKWLDWKTHFITLFTSFWTSISLLIIYLFGVTITSLFGILFFIGNIFLIYYTIAKWVNKTYIFIDKNKIFISCKPIPIPWISDRELKIMELQTLYSKKKIRYRHHIYGIYRQNKKVSYEVCANTYNYGKKTLIIVSNAKEALFIEKKIKQYLNFENEYISSGIWVDEPPDFLDKILGE